MKTNILSDTRANLSSVFILKVDIEIQIVLEKK